MGLLQKLKSTLGLGGRSRRRDQPRHDQRGEVDVTVEHEPDAQSEAAVKGTDAGQQGNGTGGDSDDERSFGEDETAVAEEAADESESETAAEGAEADEGVPVDELSGIGSAYAERLGDAGVETVADLAEADAEAVAEESGIAQGRVEGWIEQAKEY